MKIYVATKDTELANIELDTFEHFFRGLVVQCLLRYPILNVYNNIRCFSPKEIQQLLIMEHGTSDFYNRLVLSFNYCILFGSIGHSRLFLDTILLAKIDELI